MVTRLEQLEQQQTEQFYKNNYQWLYNWLSRHLRHQHNLEDILQDTFLKIFINPKQIASIRDARPFLATTAKNIIISQARRKKIEQQYLDYLAKQESNPIDCSPEQQLLMIEALDLICEVLSGLAARPRQVMIMYYLEGISQIEISKQLNLSVKTIKADLIKAVLYCHKQMHHL
jgi:RNA polymerase sigma factor (sigma-70 family)